MDFAEEDAVDPKQILENKCKLMPKCAPLFAIFQDCEARVRNGASTTATYVQELLDLTQCVDECVT